MDLTEKIHLSGLRLTQPRQKILTILSHQSQPICFEEYSLLDPTLDKSTFYRNMQTFETANIIQGIESDEGRRYFELADTLHPHFVCQQCHTISCLEPIPAPVLNGYQINSITYKGNCPQCSES
ncbi:MAG: transcriptional repressor [Sulfuricurvum sp.]|uniref:Fur family transcriptional regulator n=1 Tax=Sulfuricurvum sp. TaxID=2025608 RepID=UPI00260BE7F1|nr:transcriptional repressor [Sulfuricurvum sp.]MDD2829523.1 transcriptional repressor [Sulfuricurvum sp.]MDD4950455.1 transcriptional repressor [Sulfuricurvum sp.]